MEVTSTFRSRRRPNSVANMERIVPRNESSSSGSSPSVDRETLAPHRTRFRHASFILSGEPHTTLDNLVDSASLLAVSAAATREADQIKALVSPTKGLLDLDNHRDSISDSVQSSTRIPATTTVPPCTSSPMNKVTLSLCTSSDDMEVSVKKDSSCSIEHNPKQLTETPFVWHNTDAFSINPLTSDLVVNYLATLALCPNSTDNTTSKSPMRPSSVIGENIAGLLPLASSSVASMTIPTKHVHRLCPSDAAHSSSPQKLSSSYDLSDRFRFVHYNKPSMWNDVAHYTAGLSDSEAWHNWHGPGYYSDNRLSALNKLGRNPHQEFDSDRSTASLPRYPRKYRSRSRFRGNTHDNPLPDTTPSSPHLSRFDVSRAYDGLLSPTVPNRKVSMSSTSLNLESAVKQCPTPPSTPDSVFSHRSTEHLLHVIHPLRSLLDHWTPRIIGSEENDDKYVYLDEETRERRAEAQACNMILPTSF